MVVVVTLAKLPPATAPLVHRYLFVGECRSKSGLLDNCDVAASVRRLPVEHKAVNMVGGWRVDGKNNAPRLAVAARQGGQVL